MPGGTPLFNYLQFGVMGGGLTRIALDTFTDQDGQALFAHVSDSGHGWKFIAGSVSIQNNEAQTSVAPAHFYLDLSAETKQPRIIEIDIGDTDVVEQRVFVTMRDTGDGLNYIKANVFANVGAVVLNIEEVVGGVSTPKSSALAFGDYRNNVDLFKIIITDDGANTITLDATSIEPSLLATWNAAPLSTVKSVGIASEAGRTTNRWDNLIVRG